VYQKMRTLLLLLLISVVLFTGCGGNISKPVGTLTLNLFQSGLTTKVIQPGLDMAVASYDIFGSGPNGSNFQRTGIIGATLTLDALATGAWNITVDARNAGGIIIASGYSTVTITAGDTITTNITVSPLTGTGALQVTLNWETGFFANPNITAKLIPKGGAPQDITFTIDGNAAVYQNNEIPAGYYTLLVYVYDDTTFKWGGAETVRIIAGQTASGARDINHYSSDLGTIDLEVDPDLQSPIGITFSGQSDQIQPSQQMTVIVTPSEAVDSYQWYLNGWALAGEINPSVTVGNLPEGHYRLDLIVAKGDIISSNGFYFAVYDTNTNRWISKTNSLYPTGYTCQGCAAYNGKIYVFGGDGSADRNINQAYDWISNSWSLKTNLPRGVRGNAVATLNNLIYSVGGNIGTGSTFTPTNLVYAYDPVTNNWFQKASMNYPRAIAGITVANGKIYVMGGQIGSTTYSVNMEEYDPETNTWTPLSSMLTSKAYFGTVTWNGKIYTLGGAYMNGSTSMSTNKIEVFDLTLKRWTTLTTTLPVALQGFACATVNNKIYLMGGYTYGVGAKATVYEWDPNGVGPWPTKQNLPITCQYFSAAVLNGRIYTIGGNYTYPFQVFEYIP
jgi:N-acetylneuraminic acid mutarotase